MVLKLFTAETRSSQRLEYFSIKNSLLCMLDTSAVNPPNPSWRWEWEYFVKCYIDDK